MRLVRLATCAATAALIGTTAAAGTANAAATDNSKLLYRATSSTGVVQLQLNLPVALGVVPNPAVLTLLGTDAQALHSLKGADVATAHSYLAGGGLVTKGALASVLAPLNRTVTATLASPGEHLANALSVPSNPLGLDLSVGDQKAAVNALSRLTTSSGSLSSAQLGSLRSLGLGTSLDTALTSLNSAVSSVVAQTSALNTALGSLPTLPPVSVPNPLSGLIPGSPTTISTPSLTGDALASTLASLPAEVQAILAKLLDGAAVKLSAVANGQSITPLVSSIASTGTTNALDVSLFGGLVDVKATKATVTAIAGKTASQAKSAASATLISVTINDGLKDLLSLVASDKGITAKLLDGTLLGHALDATVQPVVQQANAALDTVLSQLTALLSSLNSGAKLISQGTVTKSVSADGHTAEAHAIPAQVTLGLPVAPNLLTLSIGKADAVSALSVSAPTVVTPTAPLPRTGGSEGAAALALGLVGLAGGLVVYRRRQHV